MPKWLESVLEKQADKKGLTGDKRAAYIHGTIARFEKRKKEGGLKKKHKQVTGGIFKELKK